MPTWRVPVIRLNNNSNIDSGVPYFSHICGVSTLPEDLLIFLPPLSRNNSYFTCMGWENPRTSLATQSFIRTESIISFPYASNLTSRACHLAANSTFHASFPSPLRISASPLNPQPLISCWPILLPEQVYTTFISSGRYCWAFATYSLLQTLQMGKYGIVSIYFCWPTNCDIFLPRRSLFLSIVSIWLTRIPLRYASVALWNRYFTLILSSASNKRPLMCAPYDAWQLPIGSGIVETGFARCSLSQAGKPWGTLLSPSMSSEYAINSAL